MKHVPSHVRVNIQTQSGNRVAKHETKRVEQEPNGVPSSQIHHEHFAVHPTEFAHEKHYGYAQL